MTLLLPLGLLGLLSLLVLLLIYLLKPNYQQKVISSTFVWKLSLKYSKKRLPISRFRNILILICQILILCGGAFVLAKPATVTDLSVDTLEKIAIIDASASMRATARDKSRFERAKAEVQTLSDEVLAKDGIITVIVAGPSASCLIQRATVSQQSDLNEMLAGLECSYGEADIEGAMGLAGDVLEYNADAEVILYTATKYANPGKSVRVEDVSEEGEWNAAILNATAVLEDNFYTFTIDVACYGMDRQVEVICELTGVNGRPSTETTRLEVRPISLTDNRTVKLIYTAGNMNFGEDCVPIILSDSDRIYSFDQMYIHIDERDSLDSDNEFYIYGGKKPTVKLQYYSPKVNPFFSNMLLLLKQELRGRLDLEIKEVREGSPETEGYDFYIFEHTMPSELPTDGVILMVDPDRAANAGFVIKRKLEIPNWQGDGEYLAGGEPHPLTNYMTASRIQLTEYTEIDEDSLDRYKVLMYYQGNPVFLLRDEVDSKIAVLAFDLHKSTFPLNLIDFVSWLYNFFGYFMPATFDSNVHDVYAKIELQARGADLTVSGPGNDVQSFETFPAIFYANVPGTYTVRQTLLSGAVLEESFYTKIPSSQSNIARTEDVLKEPRIERKADKIYDDLLIYLAAALVALLFLEWLLQSRSGI